MAVKDRNDIISKVRISWKGIVMLTGNRVFEEAALSVSVVLVTSCVFLGGGPFPMSLHADEIEMSAHAEKIEGIRRRITDARSNLPIHAELNGILSRYQREIRDQEKLLADKKRLFDENEARCAADSDCSGLLARLWGRSEEYSPYERTKKELEAAMKQAEAAIADIKERAISENEAKLAEYGVHSFDVLTATVAESKGQVESCWQQRKQLEAYCESPAVRELNIRCHYLPQIPSIPLTAEQKSLSDNWCSKNYCSVLTWPGCD